MTEANPQTIFGNPSDPEQTATQTVVFVPSDGFVFGPRGEGGNNPGGEVYALIYAPGSEGYIQASDDLSTGAMVAETIEAQTPSAFNEINFTEASEEFTFVDEGSGPEFYYLHVTERTVTASN